MNMSWLWFIVIVIVAFYILSYYKYPDKTSILQTSLSQFKFEMVLQKQLLVIDDTQTKLEVIRDAWFKFSIVSNFNLDGSETWHKNRYKYNIMQAITDGEILFFPAKKKSLIGQDGAPPSDENILSIKLSAGQVVIVPLHWYYLIPNEMSVQCMGVHDLITYVLP